MLVEPYFKNTSNEYKTYKLKKACRASQTDRQLKMSTDVSEQYAPASNIIFRGDA